MSWLAWLLIVPAALVSLVLMVALAILASPLRVRGRADQDGLTGGGSWFGVGVDVDTRADRVEVRLLRWRVLRRPLRSVEADAPGADDTEPDEDAEDAEKEKNKAKRRFTPMAWRRLGRIGLREARRTLRLVHLDRLRLSVVIASEDPSLTGELYGYGCALTSALRGRWPEARVDLDADFVETRPRGSAEVALRLRPIRLSGPAVRLGWAYFMERRRARRVA